jgi:hypothetical protein
VSHGTASGKIVTTAGVFQGATMPNDLTLEEVRRMAAEAGLTRFTDEHLQQLLRATRVAQARRQSLPTAELTPADEPAHVFHLRKPGER